MAMRAPDGAKKSTIFHYMDNQLLIKKMEAPLLIFQSNYVIQSAYHAF